MPQMGELGLKPRSLIYKGSGLFSSQKSSWPYPLEEMKVGEENWPMSSIEKLPNSTKAAWLVLRITDQWQKLQVNAFAHMELLGQSLPPLSEPLKAIGIMDPCFLTLTASGLMEASLMVLYKV